MNDTHEMKVKGIAPWFGAKRSLAAAITEELDAHRVYWEPFCGSMAVLLAKPQSSCETVNDLHGDWYNLARVIQDGTAGPQFYRRARRVLFHEELYRDARKEMRTVAEWDGPLSIDRALSFLVFSWMGRNGSAGLSTGERSSNVCVRWSNNGGEPGRRWASVIQSIPAWRRRLEGVTILRRDGFDILAKIRDEPRTVIYLDPPYIKKSGKYLHDFKPADHKRLACLVVRFKRVRVVISYYKHPLLADLYPADRWTTRAVTVNKHLANANGSPQEAPEVLIINGPSYAVKEATKTTEAARLF